MFNFRKVVLGVSVQHQSSDGDQRIIRVRPDLSDVENVEFVGFRLGFRHDLHED